MLNTRTAVTTFVRVTLTLVILTFVYTEVKAWTFLLLCALTLNAELTCWIQFCLMKRNWPGVRA